jgi:hypothetical protein
MNSAPTDHGSCDNKGEMPQCSDVPVRAARAPPAPARLHSFTCIFVNNSTYLRYWDPMILVGKTKSVNLLFKQYSVRNELRTTLASH